jgi:hypothetical protein
MLPVRTVALALAALIIAATGGCSAMHTAVSKQDLAVETRMTHTIFLDPVAPADRTVFVDVKNTTDKKELDLASRVAAMLEARGYRVVDDPKRATFWLQAIIKQAGKADLRLNVGNPGAVEGAATGYLLSESTGGDAGDKAGAILLGALIGTLFDANVKDVEYTVVADLRIQQKVEGQVTRSSTDSIRQGRTGKERQYYDEITHRRAFQTRVVTKANRSNLTWEEAAPMIADGMARSLAGLF